jgi:hypothetical protein
MTTKGKMMVRYAVVQIEVPLKYLTADGEEPESEGWAVVQTNLDKYLAGFQQFPQSLLPSAKFIDWTKEER